MPGLDGVANGEGGPVRPRVYNRQLMVGLWRPTPAELEARVHYLDTWAERAIMMVVGTEDFRVRYAEAVSHRAENGAPVGKKEVPELHGLTAYLGCGKEFRQALGGWAKAEQWAELFLEGVKALIQAEFCVAKERGFGSEEDYERFFAEKFAGSCIYYSHPPDLLQPWGVYVGNQARIGCLFMRLRTTNLYAADHWHFTGIMTDSFHELVLRLQVDALAGSVAGAEAVIIRVPDEVCRRAGAAAGGLIGRDLGRGDRRELAGLLGGKGGCTHLVDLAADAASLIQSVRGRARGEVDQE